MIGISVLITKYISDDPQPGIVECQLIDAYGNEWVFQYVGESKTGLR